MTQFAKNDRLSFIEAISHLLNFVLLSRVGGIQGITRQLSTLEHLIKSLLTSQSFVSVSGTAVSA